jgi:hypothetical protein
LSRPLPYEPLLHRLLRHIRDTVKGAFCAHAGAVRFPTWRTGAVLSVRSCQRAPDLGALVTPLSAAQALASLSTSAIVVLMSEWLNRNGGPRGVIFGVSYLAGCVVVGVVCALIVKTSTLGVVVLGVRLAVRAVQTVM